MNKNYERKYFFGYHDALKIYGAPKLCTVMYLLKLLFNHPVVLPKSSLDVHLLRSLCLSQGRSLATGPCIRTNLFEIF